MPKINIWDTKKTSLDSSASPSEQAPPRAVGQTPTTADYFNSPLADDSRKTGKTKQPENLKISGFAQPQSTAKSSSEEDISFETVQRFKVLKRKQRSRQSMAVAVSEEVEEMLRQGAAAEGMTFSAWARKHLFRAMKMKIPRRPSDS